MACNHSPLSLSDKGPSDPQGLAGREVAIPLPAEGRDGFAQPLTRGIMWTTYPLYLYHPEHLCYVINYLSHVILCCSMQEARWYLAAMVTGRLFSSGFKYLLMSALCILVYMHVLVPLLFYFFLSHFSTFCVSGKMFCSDVVEGTAISDQKLKGLIMNLFYRIFVFSFWIR